MTTPSMHAFTPGDLEVFRSIAQRAEADPGPEIWRGIQLERIATEHHARAHRAWSSRAVGESRALEFNQRFLSVCTAMDLPVPVRDAVARIARDEARHVEICTRIAARFTGPGASVPEVWHRLPDPRDDASLLELTRWSVSVFCLGEVCAAGIARALLDAEPDPGMRAGLRVIFRDEAQHERFGWALARRLVPLLDADARDWLAAALAHSLAFYEHCHTGGIGKPAPADPTNADDAGDADDMVQLFYDTVEGTVLPRLAKLGIPAWEAWSLREEAHALWARAGA